jgi:hypothetical protein
MDRGVAVKKILPAVDRSKYEEKIKLIAMLPCSRIAD